MLTPRRQAADVDACLMLCAENISISIPLFHRAPLIQQLIDCNVAALCGFLFVIIKRFSDLGRKSLVLDI